MVGLEELRNIYNVYVRGAGTRHERDAAAGDLSLLVVSAAVLAAGVVSLVAVLAGPTRLFLGC